MVNEQTLIVCIDGDNDIGIKADITTPVIIPRRARNQRATVDISGTGAPLKPAAIITP